MLAGMPGCPGMGELISRSTEHSIASPSSPAHVNPQLHLYACRDLPQRRDPHSGRTHSMPARSAPLELQLARIGPVSPSLSTMLGAGNAPGRKAMPYLHELQQKLPKLAALASLP